MKIKEYAYIAHISKYQYISESPLYRTWHNMKQRCYNPKNPRYKYYGGRGIKICARWADFENFVSDMGERPNGLSIDRTNNDKDYSPENCTWSSSKGQANNRRPELKKPKKVKVKVKVKTKRSNGLYLTINGETHSCSEWARIKGIGRATISLRIKKGWTPERAINGKWQKYQPNKN